MTPFPNATHRRYDPAPGAWRDAVFVWLLRGCAAAAAVVVLLIAVFLVAESLPALQRVGPARFFTDSDWNPAGPADAAGFRLVPALVGTLLVSAAALLIAAPLGLLSAVFCRFYAPPVVSGAYRRLLELLAGIPSVVYGLWGLVVLVPLIGRWQPPGPSLLAGSLVLALMILPTIALLAEAGLAQVPREYLQAAAALGFSKRRTVWSIAMPAARSAVFTAMMLALARAVGETMAVLMVCGNVMRVPRSAFDPVRTLTANIALEMGYAMDEHRSALFVSGLMLLAAVTLLIVIADRAGRGGGGGDRYW